MKKIVIFFPLLILLFSCKKAREAFDITVPFTINSNFNLPKIDDTEVAFPETLLTVKSPEIKNTIPDEFSKNNANINSIKSVTLESVVLTIQSPPTQDFSFLKNMKLYIGAEGKPEVLLASKDNINNETPSQTLNLTPANADLAPYIKAPTYYIKTEATVIKSYTSEISIASVIKGKSVANPL